MGRAFAYPEAYMLQWASPKPGSGACIQEVLMHCPQISNSRAFVQESQCHPKIQKNSTVKLKVPVPTRLRKQAGMCQNGPIDRFQCQGNKFLA